MNWIYACLLISLMSGFTAACLAWEDGYRQGLEDFWDEWQDINNDTEENEHDEA